MLLDPFYRTISGFAVLIEKDWCSFGHKFAQRHGHGRAAGKQDHEAEERSPVFLQFLECVYQLMLQHPLAFEYDSRLLELVADELFACRFGTFLFDCERERAVARVKSQTVSLWTFVNINRAQFINALYRESEGSWACSS